MKRNLWFKCWEPNPEADVNLFCFPHAGGGSLAFRNWVKYFPPHFQMLCAQLPGRETRLKEPHIIAMKPLVSALLEGIKPYLDKRFVFFGHSLGSVVCFELARALREEGLPLPERLFVSGRRAPQIPSDIFLSKLSDSDFLENLRQYNGTPAVLFENPGILKFFLPVLRADFKLSDDYSYSGEPPFDFPLSVFNGIEDKVANRGELLEWGDQTNGDFELKIFPGDHFYINNQTEEIVRSIAARLEK